MFNIWYIIALKYSFVGGMTYLYFGKGKLFYFIVKHKIVSTNQVLEDTTCLKADCVRPQKVCYGVYHQDVKSLHLRIILMKEDMKYSFPWTRVHSLQSWLVGYCFSIFFWFWFRRLHYHCLQHGHPGWSATATVYQMLLLSNLVMELNRSWTQILTFTHFFLLYNK